MLRGGNPDSWSILSIIELLHIPLIDLLIVNLAIQCVYVGALNVQTYMCFRSTQ